MFLFELLKLPAYTQYVLRLNTEILQLSLATHSKAKLQLRCEK